MAHFALIENDKVVQVIKLDDQYETNPYEFFDLVGMHGEWIQTSYNNRIRGKYASIGDTYDRVADVFVARPVETGPTVEELAASQAE
jgi:hypothetical protein